MGGYLLYNIGMALGMVSGSFGKEAIARDMNTN